MKKITAYDVANVFVKLGDPDSGDVLTNLKLQKLVYYAQGFHLALFGKPLFDDKIEAWEHGPVVPTLYHKLKDYKASQVVMNEPISQDITSEQLSMLGEVNDVYGQFSAWKLRNMTHNETPWLTTTRSAVIDQNKLSEYFKTQLN